MQERPHQLSLIQRQGRAVVHVSQVEITESELQIISAARLPLGSRVILQRASPKGGDLLEVTLTVVWVEDIAHAYKMGLAPTAPEASLQSLHLVAPALPSDKLTSTWAFQPTCINKVTLRQRRIPTAGRIFVSTRTLGVAEEHEFDMVNASSNGALLRECLDGEHHPYHVDSLLEMQIDCGCAFLKKPIRCLARVARTSDPAIRDRQDSPFWELGVQFIEFEPGGAEAFRSLCETLERLATPSTTADDP